LTDADRPFEALDAYQSGEMADAEAAGFEEALFDAAATGTAEEARFVEHISLLGRYLLPRSGFDTGSGRARVEALLAAGLKVQLLASESAGPGQPIRLQAIARDAEIVVTHVPIDVRGYDSVDVIVEKPDGTELKTFRDVGFDPDDGTIYAVCEAPLARISARQRHVRSRILGRRDGAQHVIAEFETLSTEPL
jgi:hypothetical protein